MPEENGVERLVRRGASSTYTYEYNCKTRRLFPWMEVANTKRPLTEFGCMIVTLEPGKQVDLHDHDEEETFIVIGGSATLEIDGKTTELYPTDVAYIPRAAKHSLRNAGPDPFVMVDIYWDLGGSGQ
ncbi:TPA: cupin domain-containing protein [Pseudomonas aeruginosa]|nr:cupin domain-containing protein [Pseudomonas aeruginosa]HCW0510185.1 cupin domain-containing protein [Pseudomonas aeruginosa]HCW0859299.1 cupin domain-containing protein [Pseudomonas aeruginosa]HCW0863570.1 cupin domain-containing protein [Pseudomonas aeruginosa]HXI06172.1 cupin domain-containing protein [Bradyrhizobium sp.]